MRQQLIKSKSKNQHQFKNKQKLKLLSKTTKKQHQLQNKQKKKYPIKVAKPCTILRTNIPPLNNNKLSNITNLILINSNNLVHFLYKVWSTRVFSLTNSKSFKPYIPI